MLIDDDLYRWTQIGIILGLPILQLIWGLVKRRIALGLVAAVTSLLGLTLALSVFTASETTAVFRVEAGASMMQSVLIGGTHYRFANGAEAALAAAGRHVTLVINNTDQPMAIMAVVYSFGGFAPQNAKPDLTIPPFSVASSRNDIDYYGQSDHAPPHSLQATAPQTTRYWLTEAPR